MNLVPAGQKGDVMTYLKQGRGRQTISKIVNELARKHGETLQKKLKPATTDIKRLTGDFLFLPTKEIYYNKVKLWPLSAARLIRNLSF